MIDSKDKIKILDVCTGTGTQAFAFAKRGYEVMGIDLSEEMLRVAKKRTNMKLCGLWLQMQLKCHLKTIISTAHVFLLDCMICRTRYDTLCWTNHDLHQP